MSVTLADVEARNPSGARRRRYFCPLCQAHGGKTPDLSLDRERGLYHCFKCGASGVLTEFREPTPRKNRAAGTSRVLSGVQGIRIRGGEDRPSPNRQDSAQSSKARRTEPRLADKWQNTREVEAPSEIEAEYVERCRRDFPASPADDYERSRGIDGVKTGMGYDPHYPFLVGDEWVHERAVVFFFQDLEGRVVAKQGRMLRPAAPEETAKITFGKVSQGVFNAAALAGDEVVICEGPNSAAALIERGYPAIALGGKFAQEWLLDALVDRRVWLGLDNDPAGQKAAAELHAQLSALGCDVNLLLPLEAGQDWNDVLHIEPAFELPGLRRVKYQPTLEDVRAQCRRTLRTARGDARDLLEEWEYAIDSSFEAARAWWHANGDRLRLSLR